jgi:uncharacterized membrane protein YraQ (UPF0718 family)
MKKAFSRIGLGVGFALWILLKDVFWLPVGFFVCSGIGYLLDELKVSKLKASES